MKPSRSGQHVMERMAPREDHRPTDPTRVAWVFHEGSEEMY